MTARLGNGLSKDKGRTSPLPSYQLDKSARAYGEPWTTSVYLPLPAIRGRRLRILLPVPPRIYRASVSRFGRKRGSAVFAIGLVLVLYVLLSIARGIRGRSRGWSDSMWTDPPTLVFERPELERIWQWEISAGHYPSTRLGTCRGALALTCVTHITACSTRGDRSLGDAAEPGSASALECQRIPSTALGNAVWRAHTNRHSEHRWHRFPANLPRYCQPTTSNSLSAPTSTGQCGRP